MQLAFDSRGAGPPLILLHALGADRRVWDPVMDRLSAERDVVALDLPGLAQFLPAKNTSAAFCVYGISSSVT